jgi:hypothetical protein
MWFDEDFPPRPSLLARRQDLLVELNAQTTPHRQQIKGKNISFETLFRGPFFTFTNDNPWDNQDAPHNHPLWIYIRRTKQ